jgi:hypothetical protein
MLFASCKKEVVIVDVDAFAALNTTVSLDENVYKFMFSLEEYPYQEVGVKLSSIKSTLNEQGGNVQIAIPVGHKRYGVFYDALVRNTVYYYQIYVVDQATSQRIHSDVYSFKTNP